METKFILMLFMLIYPTFAEWEEPIFSKPEGFDGEWNFHSDGPLKILIIKIKEEQNGPISMTYIHCNHCNDDNSKPKIGQFTSGSSSLLGPEIEKMDDNKYKLKIKNKLDYENEDERLFKFMLSLPTSSEPFTIRIDLIDVDDTPPNIHLDQPTCNVYENITGETKCIYKVTDPDSDASKLKFSFSNYESYFQIKITAKSKNEIEAMLIIVQSLDFDKMPTLYFVLTAKDPNGNNGTANIFINVQDVNNKPPEWNDIFPIRTFDENTDQIFSISARDGDYGIDDQILYEWKDEVCLNYNILLKQSENKVNITVNKIDRDTEEMEKTYNTIECTILAIEDNEKRFSTSATIRFMILDQNDNQPSITLNDKNVLKLNEGQSYNLENIFTINDIDEGINAQYEVTFINENPNIDHSEAFQIIPNNGYKKWNFSIATIKPELLDYENTTWQKFTLNIESKDKGEPVLNDKQTITIELINLNDEIPHFVEKDPNYYVVSIPEDAPADTFILNLLAIDKDIDDSITYNLPNDDDFKFNLQKNKSATIYTKRDNVFDYEKIKQVIIQFSATDTLKIEGDTNNLHTVTQQITINVLDVNDEKPRITLPSNIKSVFEHSEVGFQITNEIKAEDVDTDALLEFSINWDETIAFKLGVPQEDKLLFEDVVDIETTYKTDSEGNKKLGSAIGILKIKNSLKFDYENFEIIYLRIIVTDKNQKDNNMDAGTLAIILDDTNDQKPEFDMNTIKADKILQEHSNSKVKIGTIVATDADGPKFNKISYSLKEKGDTKENLVKINPKTGELTVDGDELIDADKPKTYFLEYTVFATDSDFTTNETIKINITDINDLKPELEEELSNEKQVSERNKKDDKEFVQTVKGIDYDRDPPHNKIRYYLNNEINPKLASMFTIDEETGDIYASGDIPWTSENNNITIYIIMQDIPGISGKPNEDKQNFTVKIIDTDDQRPQLPDSINVDSISENEESGIKAKIIATDADEPCTKRTYIDYSIIKIIDEKTNEEISNDIFKLNKKEETEEKDCQQIAELTINKSLRGFYGNYKICIRAENPETKDTNFDEKFYKINIKPYNFVPPTIIFPSDKRIILRKEQKKGEKLYDLNNNPINDFEATDNQDGKFIMKFKKGDVWDDVFDLKTNFDNKATLILTLDKPPKQDYELKVRASHDGIGSVATYVDQTFKVSFIDQNSLPEFSETVKELQFTENKTEECHSFPNATDFKCTTIEDCVFMTYYHLMNTEEQRYFDVHKNEPEICLNNVLDREKNEYHYLTIVSTNFEKAPSYVPENHVPLNLTIKVLDINDNPPVFEKKLFTGGVADTDKTDSEIVELKATDADLEEEPLRYIIIEDTINVSDDSLNDIKYNAFEIRKGENIIRNKFQPKQDMAGYFSFTVNVLDSDDNSDFAEVKIYIISDTNRITFTFENDIDKVKENSGNIEAIFTKEFGYTGTIDEISKTVDENTGQSLSNSTDVKIHFIDEKIKSPVPKENLKHKLEDIQTISSLKLRFKDIELNLAGFENDPLQEQKQLDNVLKIILIVVSVVLGTLCIILFAAFILRTRSLKKRLEAMTTNVFGSTKSDLNRIGTAVPGTNKHAIEANPVWNEDLNATTQYDTMSQASGGSDLIGIEDKPDFDYDFRRASINPVLQANFANEDLYADVKSSTDSSIYSPS